MKIAITGHKKGIGQAFAKQLEQRGHTIIGISRSDGENIRRVKHTASIIESCDLFINNAISQYAQTELFFEVWQRWKGERKWIWHIGSIVSILPKVPEEQAGPAQRCFSTKQAVEIRSASKSHPPGLFFDTVFRVNRGNFRRFLLRKRFRRAGRPENGSE